jgi:hypothetical protein
MMRGMINAVLSPRTTCEWPQRLTVQRSSRGRTDGLPEAAAVNRRCGEGSLSAAEVSGITKKRREAVTAALGKLSRPRVSMRGVRQ